MASFTSIYSAIQGKMIQIPDFPTVEPTSPRSFFEKEGNIKPSITISIWNLERDEAKKLLIYELKNMKVELKTACTYLYKLAEETKEVLDKDWTSYGVNIFKVPGESVDANKKVSPLDLVEIKTNETNKDVPAEAENLPDITEENLLLAVTGPYRTGKIMDLKKTAYKHSLIKKVKELIQFPTGIIWSDLAFPPQFSSDVAISFLIAMWDMFLQKFPNHSFVLARWGTVVTRYQDSSILETLKKTAESSGIKWTEIGLWCTYPQISKEMKRLLDSEEEIDNLDGYLPYIRSMGISSRSPYSTSANPNLHYFCKMLAVIQLKEIGFNAVVVEGAVEGDANRMVVLFATATGFLKNFNMQHLEPEEKRRKLDEGIVSVREGKEASLDAENEGEDPFPPPTNRNPDDWILWLKQNDGKNLASVKKTMVAKQEMVRKRGRKNRDGSFAAKFISINW